MIRTLHAGDTRRLRLHGRRGRAPRPAYVTRAVADANRPAKDKEPTPRASRPTW